MSSLTLAEGHEALLHGVADVDLEGRDHLSVCRSEGACQVRGGLGGLRSGAWGCTEPQRGAEGSDRE